MNFKWAGQAAAVLSLICTLISCATSKVENVRTQLPPLPEGTPVTVHAESAPNYGYEVICEASVSANPLYSGSELSDYESQAEKIARKCGTDRAMVESLFGFGNNVTVKIKAIRKTSEDDKITDKRIVEKIIAAAALDNVANLKKIFADIGLNPDPSRRSPNDSDLLALTVLRLAERGSTCPVKSLNFLKSEYAAQLRHVDDYGADRDKIYVNSDGILSCPSPVISQSYDHFADKEKSITAINQVVTENLNSGAGDRGAIVSYGHFLTLYPRLMKDVDASCAQDSTSSLCSHKPNLEKVRKLITPAREEKAKKAVKGVTI
jgi:hypothetical protein